MSLRIGVIMPSYNQDKWLAAALEGYAKQTSPSDLVVVNDASTDNTVQILKGHSHLFKIVVTHEKNKGSAEAINTGVCALDTFKGEYDALTWISSDNVMAPSWLEILSRAMEENEAGVTYGGFTWKKGNQSHYLFRQHQRDHLINDRNCYYGPAFLIRGDVWKKAGPHRGRISHDYDHWLRVEEVCYRLGLPILGIDRDLCLYNAHDERATVIRAHEFDAHYWQEEAKKRRAP